MRTPTWEYRTLINVPFCKLADLGYTHYIIDVDNTLTTRRSTAIDPALATTLKTLLEQGKIKICLLSNVVFKSPVSEERVEHLADLIGAQHVCAYRPYLKPHKIPFMKSMFGIGATSNKTIVIGDQRLTDILGANRLGIESILVRPLGSDHIVTTPKRVVEMVIRLLVGIRPVV